MSLTSCLSVSALIAFCSLESVRLWGDTRIHSFHTTLPPDGRLSHHPSSWVRAHSARQSIAQAPDTAYPAIARLAAATSLLQLVRTCPRSSEETITEEKKKQGRDSDLDPSEQSGRRTIGPWPPDYHAETLLRQAQHPDSTTIGPNEPLSNAVTVAVIESTFLTWLAPTLELS